MTPLVEFVVPGWVIPKARPRVTARGTFTPQPTREYERIVAAYAKIAMLGKTSTKKPVVAVIAIQMAKPKRAGKSAFPIGCPDLDNMVKAITDAMNGIVFDDDSQIVELLAAKVFGETPGAAVIIYEVDP